MSRYSQNQDRSSFGLITRGAQNQAKKMRRYIEENEIMSSGIASRINKGGKLEELLGKVTCEKFREELKENAKENALIDRRLDGYVAATTAVCAKAQNDIVQQRETKPKEYSEQMESEYKTALATLEQNAGPVTEAPLYTKLCGLLGEGDEEDEELAVVNDQDTSVNSIKCPLTMAIMENPFKSSVCHHTFERDAIFQHLRKSKKCPKPGCNNVRMTANEFSEDPETAMKIRRYLKREEATKRAEARSALDMDDDDDE